jgi:hypothetical protein
MNRKPKRNKKWNVAVPSHSLQEQEKEMAWTPTVACFPFPGGLPCGLWLGAQSAYAKQQGTAFPQELFKMTTPTYDTPISDKKIQNFFYDNDETSTRREHQG